MSRWKPTARETLFLCLVLIAWATVYFYLPPDLAGTDAYLFRDAACNFLAGEGFRTASFEHSDSFRPVLYSSYTPLSLWVFMVFAKVLGCGTTVAQIYPRILALLSDVAVLFAGLRFLVKRWQRWVWLICLAAVLPVGLMNPATERPEGLSFLLLLALVLVLRRKPSMRPCIWSGLLGAAAFLSEPFAGVLAVFLIAGWLLAHWTQPSEANPDRRWDVPSFARTFFLRGIVSALFFVIPIAAVAYGFYRIDNQSISRFEKQAVEAGISRTVHYSESDNARGGPPAAPTKTGFLTKYKDAAAFQESLGVLHLIELFGFLVIGAIWVLLLVQARGAWQGKLSLLIAGLACFVLPVLVFPLQSNYLTLTRLLFPILLAFNWAKVRSALRFNLVVPVLLIVNVLAVFPTLGESLVRLSESQSSYHEARQQVGILHRYLAQHPLHGRVVLAPATHYFLYKDAARNIYNPSYLSYREDPQQVAAVVNCYAASKDFQPGTLPLPPFVAHEQWKKLSQATDIVAVSLLHHRLMSRNWSMACDLYVRADVQ